MAESLQTAPGQNTISVGATAIGVFSGSVYVSGPVYNSAYGDEFRELSGQHPLPIKDPTHLLVWRKPDMSSGDNRGFGLSKYVSGLAANANTMSMYSSEGKITVYYVSSEYFGLKYVVKKGVTSGTATATIIFLKAAVS